jgi:hypothetical protein
MLTWTAVRRRRRRQSGATAAATWRGVMARTQTPAGGVLSSAHSSSGRSVRRWRLSSARSTGAHKPPISGRWTTTTDQPNFDTTTHGDGHGYMEHSKSAMTSARLQRLTNWAAAVSSGRASERARSTFAGPCRDTPVRHWETEMCAHTTHHGLACHSAMEQIHGQAQSLVKLVLFLEL